MVSRIPEPVSAMSSRAIPIPTPPLGGIPYSIAPSEVLVERHRLVITGRGEHGLGLETLPLHDRIDQLRVGRRRLDGPASNRPICAHSPPMSCTWTGYGCGPVASIRSRLAGVPASAREGRRSQEMAGWSRRTT